MENKYNKGSEWKKWDLHIHTPLSIVQTYGGEDKFDDFIEGLENLPEDVKVIGINDYYFIDGYKKVMKYKKDGKLKNIDKILPILEFRIDTFGSASESKFQKVNFHILFDIDEGNLDKEIKLIEDEFINRIKLSKHHDTKVLSKDNFISESSDNKLKTGFNEIIPSTEEVKKLLLTDTWKNKTFTFLGYVEWNNLNKSSQLKPEKEALYKIADAFFTASETDNITKKEEVLYGFGNKPLLHSGDIHNFKKLGEDYKCFTWIKADPTFEGLKQIIYEPEERVKIQESNPEYDFNKPYFNSIEIKEDIKIYNDDNLKFEKTEIIFNKNLVTIIGGRGEGKSTLINYLGNSLKQYENKDFTLDNNFIIEYHKLNKEYDLESEDIQKFKSSERENQELDFIFIKQGDLKEKTKKDLSESLKKMLKIENTSFSENLNNEIFNLNQEIENIEQWKKQKDENGILINSVDLQEKNIKKYIKLIENLQNSKNKEQIENYNKNLKKISEYKNIIFQGKQILEKIDNFIEDIKNINKDKKFKDIDLSEYKSNIETTKEDYENKVKDIEKENVKIKDELQKSGISGDLTSLLENITKYQNIIDQAEKKKKEIEQKEKELKNLKNKRSELGEKIKNEYENQKQEIDEKWKSFLSKKTDKQQKIIKRILLDGDKLEISGKIIFDKEKFYKLLWDSLHHGQYKENELEEKFGITDLESFSDYIKNNFNNDYDNIKFKKQDFIDLFFSLEKRNKYLRTEAEIKYDGKELSKLSAGQKGTTYLRLHLANSAFDKPIIFDQPEDDLDNKFIMNELVDIFKELKKYRQIIIVTHNANLVVNSDAEQVIIAENKNGILNYISGSLENKIIQEKVCDILEGGKEAFDKRKKKYNLK